MRNLLELPNIKESQGSKDFDVFSKAQWNFWFSLGEGTLPCFEKKINKFFIPIQIDSISHFTAKDDSLICQRSICRVSSLQKDQINLC